MADDIPGTPGQRTIGGEPLAEAASDDNDSGSSGGGGGGSSGSSGGSGGGGADEPDVAPDVSGDAVRRSLEEDISVEEAQRQINEEQGGGGGSTGGGSSGSSTAGGSDAGGTTPETPTEGRSDDLMDTGVDVIDRSREFLDRIESESDAGNDGATGRSRTGSTSPSAGGGSSSGGGGGDGSSGARDQTETVDAEAPPGRTLTGQEVKNLVAAQQDPSVSDEEYSRLKESYLTNEAVPTGTAAERLQRDAVDQADQVDDPSEVEIVRDGQNLEAQPSEQGREEIAQSVASQSEVIDRSDVQVGENFGARLTKSGQRDIEAAIARQRGVDQSLVEVNERGQLTKESRARITSTQSNRQLRQEGTIDGSGTQSAGEPDDWFVEAMNRDTSETQSQSQTRTQSTQAPGSFQETFDETPTSVSPLAGMAVEDEQVQQALAGEAELARRANEGDVGAQVAMIGRGLQRTGEGIRRGAVDAAEAAGADAGPDVGNASVGEQVASFAGGTLGFPLVLAGGATQAAGVATQSEARQGSLDRLQDTTTTAAESQAEFIGERPVEAGLIVGTAAAMSPRARSAARSGAERVGSGVRSVTERARTRARTNRLISDERGMADLTGRSRSRSQSGEQSGQRSVPERDPVRRQATEGRASGGRVVGDDGGITVRGPARSMQRSQEYAQRVRTVSRMQGEGEIPGQLSDAAVIDPVQPSDGSAAATAAAAGDLLSQAQQQQATVADQQMGGQQGRTAGGTADAVTQGQQQRVQQAQRQEVTLDDAIAEADARYFGVDAEQGTAVQDQEILGETEAVQGSSVTSATGQPRVGDRDTAGGRPEGPRQDQPSDQRSGPGVGETPGEREGQGDQPDTTPDTIPDERAGTPPRLDIPPVQRMGEPGRPGPGPRQTPEPPRPPRSPSLPRFGFSFGVGSGIGGGRKGPAPEGGEPPLDTGWLNETTVDFALGGFGSGGAPSQETLAAQPESLQLTGQLPTQAEVSGSQEEQERIDTAQAFLSFGETGQSGSDGSSDGWFAIDQDEGGDLL